MVFVGAAIVAGAAGVTGAAGTAKTPGIAAGGENNTALRVKQGKSFT